MPPSGATPAVPPSDSERDAALARLRTATAEGRLTLDEFADAIDRVLAAADRAELETLTAGVPEPATDGAAAAAPAPGRSAGGRRWIVAIMGGGTHRGRWRVAPRCTVINIMGGADLDLTNAVVEAADTEIRVFSFIGGATIIVPPGVHAELTGFAFMGGNDLRLDSTARRSTELPVVRVRAFSIMGGTTVKTKSLQDA